MPNMIEQQLAMKELAETMSDIRGLLIVLLGKLGATPEEIMLGLGRPAPGLRDLLDSGLVSSGVETRVKENGSGK